MHWQDPYVLLFLQLAILLATARFLGEIARRFGWPAVVGELVGGILLGPSVAGALFPQLKTTLFPTLDTPGDPMAVAAWLGVIFLVFLTGIETDVQLIRRKGRQAILISLGGIIVPFSSGYLLGLALPLQFLVHPEQRMVFALFVATAMSISAIPVIARVLMELKLIKTHVGQLILSAAMIDDTIGWILLGVVAHLATVGTFEPMLPIRLLLIAVGVLVLSLVVGVPLLRSALKRLERAKLLEPTYLSICGVLIFLGSAVTMGLGLEAILGSFVAGLVLREAAPHHVHLTRGMEETTRLVLAPIFFAAAGLKVDLFRFAHPSTIAWAGAVLAIACIGKFGGAFLGSKLAGLRSWEGIAMGAGLNARGAMEIIVATTGLKLGILTIDMYSIIVFVAVATSLMAPPLLRWSTAKIPVAA